jgi:hypothetical protein
MAVISRERTRATWFTGVAGLLILGVAIVMMVVAPPSQAHSLPHHTQAQNQAQAQNEVQAYTLSMITESWSANGPDRAARSPLANPR